MQGRTKDEQFMIKLYEVAKESGSPYNIKDSYAIGALLGISDKVVRPMIALLAQANFIKKSGETGIFLTPRGEELVKSLLEE